MFLKKMNRTRTVVLASILGIALAGCGSGIDQAKADKALARINSRPAPGYIRLINLSDSIYTMTTGAIMLAHEIPANGESKFSAIGFGRRTVQIKSDKGLVDRPIDVESKAGQSLIVMPDRKTIANISGEMPTPTESLNLSVFQLDEDGKPVSSKLEINVSLNGKPVTIDTGKVSTRVEPGAYSISAAGAEAVEQNVASDKSYTLLIVRRKSGKSIVKMIENTGMTKPIVGGMAKS